MKWFLLLFESQYPSNDYDDDEDDDDDVTEGGGQWTVNEFSMFHLDMYVCMSR